MHAHAVLVYRYVGVRTVPNLLILSDKVPFFLSFSVWLYLPSSFDVLNHLQTMISLCIDYFISLPLNKLVTISDMHNHEGIT